MRRHYFIVGPLLIAVLIILPAACNTTNPDTALPDSAVETMATDLSPIERLGKELFFAKISNPPSMSCADCHGPSVGWTGPIAGNNLHGAVYRGAVAQRFGNRKPPTVAYAAFAPVLYALFCDENAVQNGECKEEQREELLFFGGTFWDGRATGWRLGNPIAEQALGPFLNPVEQNMPSEQAVCQAIARSKKLSRLFEEAWEVGSLDCSDDNAVATYDLIGHSIGAYESSAEVNPFSSKFDAYWAACLAAGNDTEACGLAEGEKQDLDPLNILTEQEFDGLIEFGEYCSDCHVSHIAGPETPLWPDGTPPLFTDYSYHNVGVPKNPKNPYYDMDRVFLSDGSAINPAGAAFIDLGLGGFLQDAGFSEEVVKDQECKFKTPTVRNVDARPGMGFPKAYMHNGVFKSLHEVVDFYNTRDVPERNWPDRECERNLNEELFEGLPIGDFQLEDEDVEAIVAFMKTLTDGYRR